jgi:hypothetical protein
MRLSLAVRHCAITLGIVVSVLVTASRVLGL